MDYKLYIFNLTFEIGYRIVIIIFFNASKIYNALNMKCNVNKSYRHYAYHMAIKL